MKKNKKNAFTLVELLAVIVILAIVLVIAVPKVMSVIEDSKKATLESTAKMIASSAEKQKVQNTVLGKDTTITCDSIAKINKLDYDTCDIEFDGNTAKVTIKGKGKFAGLHVCGGTKTIAEASDEECAVSTKGGALYITNLLKQESTMNNGLMQITAEYEGTTYDAGIRYVGYKDEVKNKVYYNCEDTDTNGVSYGNNNYDYVGSCETWRIIGVFDTKSSIDGANEKRIKIINTESTFEASWDSSEGSSNNNVCNGINCGDGINQWGESTYEDGRIYEGADLMQLLNGYYIEKNNPKIAASDKKECKYFGLDENWFISELICDTESSALASQNMKPLTSNALSMINDAIWDIYAVEQSVWELNRFLQEKGISAQYTGKSECTSEREGDCNDEVVRTTRWLGLVGLMSASDVDIAKGWLHDQGNYIYPWTITPNLYYAGRVFCSGAVSYLGMDVGNARGVNGVYPSVYLKSGVKIIDGNGDDEPYKLAL